MLLTYLLLCPLVTCLILLVNPVRRLVKPIALTSSIVSLILAFVVLGQFDTATADLQMVEIYKWIPSFGINYFIGVDGISILLVMLTNFLTPLIILSSWKQYEDKNLSFHVCLLSLQSFMLGSFLAMDLILFYSFWELSLIPMYFMIGIWGGPKRIYAGIKFFIFTMFGSVLMLLAIISLIYMTKAQLGEFSGSILDVYQLSITYIKNSWASPQTLMFLAFALAFAIKVPMFPLHSWLPDAHTEAPTAGSVVLAGVMLKMGTYALLRFVLPVFPEVVADWAWVFLFLGVVGIIYGSLVAMVQTDIKRLIAFSSVAHMGYIVVGIFSLNIYGLTGSLYQMLNHGISTGALFLLVGVIYDRTQNRRISDYSGLATKMPIFSIVFFIVTMSSIAVPGTNGFIGEFLILLGTFGANNIFGFIAMAGVVLGAVYMLRLYKNIFYGEPSRFVGEQSKAGNLMDLRKIESFVLGCLVVLIFWMGILPGNFLKYSERSLEHLSENIANYDLRVKQDSNEQGAQ